MTDEQIRELRELCALELSALRGRMPCFSPHLMMTMLDELERLRSRSSVRKCPDCGSEYFNETGAELLTELATLRAIVRDLAVTRPAKYETWFKLIGAPAFVCSLCDSVTPVPYDAVRVQEEHAKSCPWRRAVGLSKP